MRPALELAVSGQATANVRVNLRQGLPSIRSPVLRKLNAGTTISIQGVVIGDSVQGNAHWYRTADGAYAWAGAFSPIREMDLTPASASPPVPHMDADPSLNRVPLVVDIYHGDGVVSFDQAFAAGLRGVIHKATTGASGTDDAYKRRRDLATRAGLLWGATHWGTAHSPISDQVDNFLRWADPDKDTLVALDYERDEGNQMTLEGAREFLQLVNDRLKRKAVLYSGDTVKSALGKKSDPFFGSHRLWLAQYGSNPTVHRSWKSYWLWQYTDGEKGPGRKTVPGIPGDRLNRLDCDHFPGGLDELKAQWAG
ncbi:GH25 family lysozyme [Bradyrhizobium sp. STM 3557]|uniref:GH25 family lysozyme n=1 Tax=Bradyrhizobium sp. STM 3557 TaxID=578920 RepID=UPI00388D9E8A